jgi:hypothetical protein
MQVFGQIFKSMLFFSSFNRVSSRSNFTLNFLAGGSVWLSSIFSGKILSILKKAAFLLSPCANSTPSYSSDSPHLQLAESESRYELSLIELGHEHAGGA